MNQDGPDSGQVSESSKKSKNSKGKGKVNENVYDSTLQMKFKLIISYLKSKEEDFEKAQKQLEAAESTRSENVQLTEDLSKAKEAVNGLEVKLNKVRMDFEESLGTLLFEKNNLQANLDKSEKALAEAVDKAQVNSQRYQDMLGKKEQERQEDISALSLDIEDKDDQIKSLTRNLKKSNQELGLVKLKPPRFEEAIKELAKQIHTVIKEYFLELCGSEESPAIQTDPYKAKCFNDFPSWFPHLASKSKPSIDLRIAAAEHLISKIITMRLFQPFYVLPFFTTSVDIAANISSRLVNDGPRKEAALRSAYRQIFRLAGGETTLLSQVKTEILHELSSLTSGVSGDCVGSNSSKREADKFSQNLDEMLTDALKLWEDFVHNSHTRVIASMEDSDSEWDELEEHIDAASYGCFDDVVTAYKAQMGATRRRSLSLFPTVYCPDPQSFDTANGSSTEVGDEAEDSDGRLSYFWGYALKESSALVVAAKKELACQQRSLPATPPPTPGKTRPRKASTSTRGDSAWTLNPLVRTRTSDGFPPLPAN